jgi:hypothetical protein
MIESDFVSALSHSNAFVRIMKATKAITTGLSNFTRNKNI